jgi:signal transduction histidine kinase
MSRVTPVSLPRSEGGYLARVANALDARRVGAVALVTVAISLGPMYSAELVEFFSPFEIAVEWLNHLGELAVLAAVLVLAYTVLDEALPAHAPARRWILCGAMLCLSAALTTLLYAYYARGFDHLPPPRRLLADTMRFGLPAVFMVLVADVHRRALQIDSAARAADLLRRRLMRDESAQQLGVLQAQIEPHFIFNVLGNVRRLYRTRPQSGSETITSLMRYLHAALPQMRSRGGTLGEELDLVRAYLELCQVRMGVRLTFAVEADPALRRAEFPPMLLITLVENAIKHGLEPVGGGEILVRARLVGDNLTVEVLDDGAGFGTAGGSGTGVGLVNVQRRLAAHYPGQARLALIARAPRGASATISIPVSRAIAHVRREPGTA